MQEFNLLVAGVGGQGVILMSELLGQAAVSDGFKVRGSEVLGMAVRGGPVMSAIRMGSDVYGPLIPAGRAHLLIGMEPSEALRNSIYLTPDASVIVNTRTVVPFTVSLGQSGYPPLDEILATLKQNTGRVVSLDADVLAAEAGNLLTANIVMLGAAFGTGLMPIREETIKAALETHFPAKLLAVNLKAFEMGYRHCQQAVGDNSA
jgi:indolepyruvate ferredoxin oxidoreductase, beta subunit